MSWQYFYLLVLFLSAILSLGIANYAWRFRLRPGLLYFTGMMLAMAGYSLTAGLMSSAATPELAKSWVNPHYFCLTMMVAFYFCFVLQFTGHGKWLNKFSLSILFSIPIITQLVIETNPFHHAFIQEIQFKPDGILQGLDLIQYGGFFYFHTVYSYLLVLIGIGFLLVMSIRSFHFFRLQSLTLFLAILAPLLGSINDSKVFLAGFPYPIVPICFFVMGALLAWNVFHNQMLNIIPVARDVLVESMQDSLIVLDVSQIIIDINPAAMRLFQISREKAIGKPVTEVLFAWKDSLSVFLGKTEAEEEICIKQDSREQYFDVKISQLLNKKGRLNGQLIVLRDVTKRVLAEQKIQDALKENHDLQQQLYQHSIRDELTGFYNRRYFEDVLPREVDHANRSKKAFSFVMMDIDHFKTINDTYGHAVGDEVLKNVSHCLREQTRKGDLIFRYGGEEFIALLKNTEANAAYHIADRWLKTIKEQHLNHQGEKIHITMSMGVAEFKLDGETYMDVLQAADKAMYQAKADGRNLVCLYQARN